MLFRIIQLLGMIQTQLPQLHLYIEVEYRVIPTQLAQNYLHMGVECQRHLKPQKDT